MTLSARLGQRHSSDRLSPFCLLALVFSGSSKGQASEAFGSPSSVGFCYKQRLLRKCKFGRVPSCTVCRKETLCQRTMSPLIPMCPSRSLYTNDYYPASGDAFWSCRNRDSSV